MDWVFVKNKPNLQVDTVGNIIQQRGGVKPNACQNCKATFDYTPTDSVITDKIPFYQCLECSFKNGGASAALDHKIETSHNIKKSQSERFVGVRREIQGSKANINMVDGDCIILCDDCN